MFLREGIVTTPEQDQRVMIVSSYLSKAVKFRPYRRIENLL